MRLLLNVVIAFGRTYVTNLMRKVLTDAVTCLIRLLWRAVWLLVVFLLPLLSCWIFLSLEMQFFCHNSVLHLGLLLYWCSDPCRCAQFLERKMRHTWLQRIKYGLITFACFIFLLIFPENIQELEDFLSTKWWGTILHENSDLGCPQDLTPNWNQARFRFFSL